MLKNWHAIFTPATSFGPPQGQARQGFPQGGHLLVNQIPAGRFGIFHQPAVWKTVSVQQQNPQNPQSSQNPPVSTPNPGGPVNPGAKPPQAGAAPGGFIPSNLLMAHNLSKQGQGPLTFTPVIFNAPNTIVPTHTQHPTHPHQAHGTQPSGRLGTQDGTPAGQQAAGAGEQPQVIGGPFVRITGLRSHNVFQTQGMNPVAMLHQQQLMKQAQPPQLQQQPMKGLVHATGPRPQRLNAEKSHPTLTSTPVTSDARAPGGPTRRSRKPDAKNTTRRRMAGHKPIPQTNSMNPKPKPISNPNPIPSGTSAIGEPFKPSIETKTSRNGGKPGGIEEARAKGVTRGGVSSFEKGESNRESGKRYQRKSRGTRSHDLGRGRGGRRRTRGGRGGGRGSTGPRSKKSKWQVKVQASGNGSKGGEGNSKGA
uniref:Uncharacterized protein n=1 Tax=Amorphochlora amoebiformis TaxID=1561963 RepID=A0A7S0D140_9EUKA